MNSSGVVTFFGPDDNGFAAIFTAQGGMQTFVAQTQVTVSDGSLLIVISNAEPDINDAAQVAFVGSFRIASGCSDFVLRTTAGVPARVAAGGIGDGCNGPEFIEGPLAMNGGGQVAWVAGLDTGADAVFVGTNQIVAGATEILDTFAGVALNDAGRLAFLREQFTTPRVKGIYTGPDPVADKLIATGDSLFGSTVTDLEFDRDGLNNAGQVAFAATLLDGRCVVVRADP